MVSASRGRIWLTSVFIRSKPSLPPEGAAAILTDDDELAEPRFAGLSRSHGMTKSQNSFLARVRPKIQRTRSLGIIRNAEVGYREYRLPICNAHSASIKVLPEVRNFSKTACEIVARYNTEHFSRNAELDHSLSSEAGTKPAVKRLYVLQIDFDRLGKSRTAVMREQLRERGVGTQVHIIFPSILQPYYRENTDTLRENVQ